MTDHLPECEWNDETRVNRHCICDRLRACEQRLASKVWEASGVSTYRYGYTSGLNAARDAVAELGCNDQCGCSVTIPNALAAIDALRGDA